MLRRFRQVAYYVAPRFGRAEEAWAVARLNGAQQALFLAMGRSDRAHAVRVARRLERQQAPAHVLEAALLHDCAKPAGFGLFWRGLGVLVAPWLVDWPAEPVMIGWRRWLQIYRWHDAYGLALARTAGTSQAALALLAAYQEGPDAQEAPDWLGPLQASDDLG